MKRGRWITILAALFLLSLLSLSQLTQADPSADCKKGDLACGTVVAQQGREFICDTNFNDFKDSSQVKGEVVGCGAQEYVAAPATAEEAAKYWVFCGIDLPPSGVQFQAVVQRADFRLSENFDVEVAPDSRDTMDYIVETTNPNQVITGVGVHFGTRKLAGLGIFVKPLSPDGTLGPEQLLSQGDPNFDMVIKGNGLLDVVTGIGLAFDGMGELAANNMMEVQFRTIDPEKRSLSKTTYKKRIGPMARLAEKQIPPESQNKPASNQNRLLIGIGATIWPEELGNVEPQPGMKRDVLGLQAAYRTFQTSLELVATYDKTMPLTDAFQDIGETFNNQPADRWYFLEAIQPQIIAILSFSPSSEVRAMKAPSGRIYARTPLQRSNAARSFGASQGKQLVRQPLQTAEEGDVRQYVCFSYNKQDYDIKYCPASGSGTSGNIFEVSPGDSFISDASFGLGLDGQRYYCLKDSNWVADLDIIDTDSNDPEGAACTDARDLGPGTQRLNYLWTGTECCGDDADESYNDKGYFTGDNAALTGRKGACWRGYGVRHLAFVETESEQSKDVIVFNGTMEGCKIDATQYNNENNNLLSLTGQDGMQLINNTPYCMVVQDGAKKFFCSFKEVWEEAGAASAMTLRQIRWPAEASFKSEKECCPADHCWDGTGCVAHATSRQGDPTYFCFHGDWKTADENIYRFSPDRKSKSLQCGPTQCFLGEGSNCVDDGFFTGDFICDKGNWTTRTKMIAEAMLQAAEDDFTLSCGKYDQVLTYFKYNYLKNQQFPFPAQDGDIETKYLDAQSAPLECEGKTTPMINNICVLDNGNAKVLFGVSLNCPVTAAQHNILDVFGKDASHCAERAASPGDYKLCTKLRPGLHEPGYAYHNPKINTLLFSPSFDPGASLSRSTACSVESPYAFIDLFNSYQSLCWVRLLIKTFSDPRQEASLREFVNNVGTLKNFDRLYIAQKGDKQIFGTLELGLNDEKRGPINYLALYYNGFAVNMCGLIKNIVGEDRQDYECFKTGSTYEIVSASSELGNLFEDTVWNDLTAKTRIQDLAITQCYDDGCNGIIPLLCGSDNPSPQLGQDPDYGSGENGCCGQGQTLNADPDCRPDRSGETFNCKDGIDNDGDGAMDACDADCGIVAKNVAAQQFPEASCADGIDNDCDGAGDAADSDCGPIGITPQNPSLIKGSALTLAVTGGVTPYLWEITEKNPAGQNVCIFAGGQASLTTASNSISLQSYYPGACSLKVTDKRGISSETTVTVTRPELACRFSAGACPPDIPTAVIELAGRSEALAALPNAGVYASRICCGINNAASLAVTPQNAAGRAFLYSLLAGGTLSFTPKNTDQDAYLSSSTEEVACETISLNLLAGDWLVGQAIRSLRIGGQPDDDSLFGGTALREGISCQSSGYDTCVFAASGTDDTRISDCDQANMPLQWCCKIKGTDDVQQPECQDDELRCSPDDDRTLQKCINRKFIDDTVCELICWDGSCA